MQLNKTRRIAAPQADVWVALNDNTILQACIPGCESLTSLDELSRQAVVVAAIGPVRAKFTGKLTLSDVQAPNRYAMVFEGQGGAAGFSKGTASVQLTAIDAQTTDLTYQAAVQVGGKLAQIGSRIVDAASEKIIGDFFTRFETALNKSHLANDAATSAPRSELVLKQGMLGRFFDWFKSLISKR